jgi:hypothetical protein
MSFASTGMRLLKIFSCSLCGGLGLLLVAVTPFGPDGMTPVRPGMGDADDMIVPDTSACLTEQSCIDRYLWAVYQRTPKIEASGADFTWKDSDAAGKAGMTPLDYVIGGMDPGFRITLYRALRALDAAGFRPGIMCGFRDDYRQSIATGKMKAQNDRSYHGGSFRGGYRHGLAADIVSVKGRTSAERSDSTGRMWDWIDRHEKELGIGRPYLNRDPPHVAPLGGEEYAAHRIAPNARRAGAAGAKAPERTASRRTGRERAEAPRNSDPLKNGETLKNAPQSADSTHLVGGVPGTQRD